MPISQCTSHQPGRPFVSAAAALATGVRTGIKWLSGNDILFFLNPAARLFSPVLLENSHLLGLFRRLERLGKVLKNSILK
jgi:hypothetical protein